jgi:hypothetical protein
MSEAFHNPERRSYFSFAYLVFGGDEYGNLRVGIPPKREKFLICRRGLGGVALQNIGLADLEMRECSEDIPAMFEALA